MKRGILYGVGVGPGDPELITRKAQRIIAQAAVLAVPDKGSGEKTALTIAGELAEGKEILLCDAPMVRDEAALDAAYEANADRVCALLDGGKDVAFLTLGDPTVYSTYLYLHRKVVARGYEAEIIPGVPSFCAVAARLGAPCHEGHQGTHGGAGGVEEEGQLLSGHTHLIRQGTHDHAAQQGAHVVVDGEQADEPGGQLYAAGGFHLTGDHLRKRLDHARLHEERDHNADEYLNEQDPDEVLVAQSLLRQSGEAEGGVMRQQQNAGETAHEQGKDRVLLPKCQQQGKRKGNQ